MPYCIKFYRGYLKIDSNDHVKSIDYSEICDGKIVSPNFSEIAMLLHRYELGEKVSFEKISVEYPYGSSFYRNVWNVTRSIPYGEVRSYKWVASKIGNPKYARAVGNALASNPILIIVPCHRVIKSDGSLGGFSSGLELKKYLLQIEGVEVRDGKVVGFNRYG